MSEFLLYLKLGLHHVLDWQAYDHVLFLIVLTAAYMLKDWKWVLFLVTAFTIGHMMSLTLAAYNIVQINRKVVEFLIPITILVVAVYNVFTAGKTLRKNPVGVLLITTACFGLIHGLGFSGYFKMVSSATDSKTLPLSAFALGIELAQIIVVIAILVLSGIIQTFFRFSKRDWVLVLSSVVIGMIIPMLISNKIW